MKKVLFTLLGLSCAFYYSTHPSVSHNIFESIPPCEAPSGRNLVNSDEEPFPTISRAATEDNINITEDTKECSDDTDEYIRIGEIRSIDVSPFFTSRISNSQAIQVSEETSSRISEHSPSNRRRTRTTGTIRRRNPHNQTVEEIPVQEVTGLTFASFLCCSTSACYHVCY